MKIPFPFMTKRKLREELLRAETEARLHSPIQLTHDLNQPLMAAAPGSTMTREDEIRYRRTMAKLHYGETTANPEYEALLTKGEKDYLDAYLIQKRWAKLRLG
jgi:hypothetical protein